MSTDNLSTHEAVMAEVTAYAHHVGTAEKTSQLLDKISAQQQTITAVDNNANQNPIEFPFLSKEENEKLMVEVSRLVASDQGQAIMRSVAKRINKDIKSINDMFYSLLNKLQEVDAKGQTETKFHGKFSTFHGRFTKSIENSRDLAVLIAKYGEGEYRIPPLLYLNFEKMILPVYNDDKITLDEKKNLIQWYINRAEDFATKSTIQKKEFEDLLSDFNNAVGEFRNFAEKEKTEIQKEIDSAKTKLQKLQQSLDETLNNAKMSLGIGAGTAAVGVILLFAVFPLALPAILVGGAVVAGVGAGVAAGFGFYAETIKSDIKDVKSEIAAKEAALADLQKLENELLKLGQDDFKLLKNSLDSIIMVWDTARRNAKEIIEALQTGKELSSLSSALQIQLTESVSTYKSAAVYLRGYASGVTGE
ncbi:hypothetical protein KCU71_g711, partial [Aureobasidium melanogenum]